MPSIEKQKKAIDRIKAGKLIRRLNDHVHGIVKLSSTQIRAAEILLKRVIPELKSIEHSGTLNLERNPAELTDAELQSIASAGSPDIVATEVSAEKPDSVH